MKLIIFSLSLMLSFAAQAETLKTQFLVTSQSGKDFWVEVMVTGVSANQTSEVQSVVEEVVTKTASQFAKSGFLENRILAISRLEKQLKKQKVTFDGIGILGLVKKGNKIIDVE